ncbi:SAM-dependent methyltransferase [Thiohalocapsa halophila]|uniref:SAM-dependent methyltransferase n=1 Tax=Thiohalocapsa halophila TaxID=69359 RepID=A0ABS1CIH6_9GAMM|nr:class I SAM-dependent methyltransferase [Thiohalocapsa halophila]MBK1631513.1 SAM-dependent methyltransferase [Thiohalocapsa halophila]
MRESVQTRPSDQLTTAGAVAAEAPDFEAIKQRQRATWASGDYAIIGTTLQGVGEALAENIDLRAGERVLDVAAGNGNATLASARRFAAVTGVDYVPQLLDKAAARAEAEGLDVELRVADAEALPFSDASFDVALSIFGAMFAPDQTRAAGELLRVVRPGGRIGLAAWTPEGFIGALLRTVSQYVQPPAGLRPPTLWGEAEHLHALFGDGAADIRCARRTFNFRYRSADHWIEVFRSYYGPLHMAFDALDGDGRSRLHADLVELLEARNIGGDSLVVPGDYLEAVIARADRAAS